MSNIPHGPRESYIKAISGIYWHSQTYITKNITKFGLSPGQWPFLAQLLFNHDGICQEELSRLINIDKSNTARGLKKLEEQGFVIRHEDPHDSRRKLVYVTDKARMIADDFHQVFRDLNVILIGDCSAEECAILRKLLYKMYDNIVGHK